MLPAAPVVGGFWNRSPFDDHDLVAPQHQRAFLTNQPIPLAAVSRGGVSATGLTATYGPAELITAWHR